eukprot:960796-Pleurochrysis_carterae.AAC.1
MFKDLHELGRLADVPVEVVLQKCKKAGKWRIDEYCKEHLRQASNIEKVRTTRMSYLETNFQR